MLSGGIKANRRQQCAIYQTNIKHTINTSHYYQLPIQYSMSGLSCGFAIWKSFLIIASHFKSLQIILNHFWTCYLLFCNWSFRPDWFTFEISVWKYAYVGGCFTYEISLFFTPYLLEILMSIKTRLKHFICIS